MAYAYVLVLGGPIQGGQPSDCLQKRIDTAVQYLLAHPETIAVVSGGKKRKNQPASEAEIMRDAMVRQGIPVSRILLENQATTTYENFVYTGSMLDAESTVAFITNEFHIKRAQMIARQAGVSFDAVAAQNPDWMIWHALREFFVSIPMWLRLQGIYRTKTDLH